MACTLPCREWMNTAAQIGAKRYSREYLPNNNFRIMSIIGGGGIKITSDRTDRLKSKDQEQPEIEGIKPNSSTLNPK